MALDLASLKNEILGQLEREDFATFFADSGTEGLNVIYWDVKRRPNFREFLHAATKCGAKLVSFYERLFSQAAIDDTLERLQESDLGREEKRSYELRLRDLQKYEGFACELEVFFDYGHHIYQFEVRTEWYEEFEDIFADVAVGEVEASDDDESEDGHMSGYFSRN
jgi:hypothetical protein